MFWHIPDISSVQCLDYLLFEIPYDLIFEHQAHVRMPSIPAQGTHTSARRTKMGWLSVHKLKSSTAITVIICFEIISRHLSPETQEHTHTQKHGSCLLSDISDGWVDGWIDPVSHLVYLASPHLLYSQSKAAITLSAGNVHHTWALRTVRLRGVGGTRVVLAARAWAHSS